MQQYNCAGETGGYKNIFHCLLLIILVIICYSNTLFQEWHFDDYPNIVYDKKLHWKKISLENIPGILQDSYGNTRLSRPLPRLSFALNYYLTGLNTVSYHLTNILIHIITAIFLYFVFKQILFLVNPKENIQFRNISYQDIALLGAILWAIHPLQTQAVTFIVQRMASMSAMFYLIALYFYIRGRLYQNFKLKSYSAFILSMLFWLGSILSKENGVLFPLTVILFEVTFFEINRKRIFFITGMIVFFIIISSVTFLLTRDGGINSINHIFTFIIDKITTPYEQRTFTMEERLFTEFRILIYYIFLVFYPVSDLFSMESDINVSTSLFNPISTFFSFITIFAIILCAIIFMKKYKLLSFSILFFFANHLIESTIIGLELYFEHRNYLPAMFLFLCISFYIIKLLDYYQKSTYASIRRLIIFFITFLLVAEGNSTYLRNDNWKSEETLCLDNIEKAPKNIRPMISLSSYYLRQQRLDDALIQLKNAEDLYKDSSLKFQNSWIAMLYHNAGSLYYQKGKYERAINYLLKSLEYNEFSWETHTLLGLLFFITKDYDNSVNAYTNAVALMQDDFRIFNMYGRALYAVGKYDIAVEVLEKGLEVANDPHKSVELYLNIVACHLKLGNEMEAKKIFSKLNPRTDDIAYLLYKFILYPDTSQDQVFQEISRIILERNINFCSWKNGIRDNIFPGLIYPELQIFEDRLLFNLEKTIQFKIEALRQVSDEFKSCDSHNSTENIDVIDDIKRATAATLLQN